MTDTSNDTGLDLSSAASEIANLLNPSKRGTQSDPPPDDTPADSESVEEEDEALPSESDEETLAESDEDEADESEEDNREPENKTEVLDAETSNAIVKIKLGDKVEEVPVAEIAKSFMRQSDYTRKTTELAEERKLLRAEREQYAALLPAIIEQTRSQEPDWQRLYAENPAEFAAQRVVYQERLAAAEAERARIEQVVAHEQEQSMAQRLETERAALLTVRPEWQDKEKFKAASAQIKSAGKALGFTDEELGQASDHRAIVALWKAAQYDALMSKRPTPAKPDRAPTLKPSSRSSVPSAKSEVQRAQHRLARSGSIDDAATLLNSMFRKK